MRNQVVPKVQMASYLRVIWLVGVNVVSSMLVAAFDKIAPARDAVFTIMFLISSVSRRDRDPVSLFVLDQVSVRPVKVFQDITAAPIDLIPETQAMI